eukprot:7682941-Pyramimonas_sp.AAC.2
MRKRRRSKRRRRRRSEGAKHANESPHSGAREPLAHGQVFALGPLRAQGGRRRPRAAPGAPTRGKMRRNTQEERGSQVEEQEEDARGEEEHYEKDEDERNQTAGV